MKHIMISIKPEHVCNILNKEKLLEIRKSIPKCILNGEECIVEIYCTKDPKHLVAPFRFVEGWFYKVYDDNTNYACGCTSNMGETINGKVVARWHLKNITGYELELWDDKTYESIGRWYYADGERVVNIFATDEDIEKTNFCKNAKLNLPQLRKYLGKGIKTCYAWHIEDLHIYDKPKKLAEFGLKRPPQSWCYIKGESNESMGN